MQQETKAPRTRIYFLEDRPFLSLEAAAHMQREKKIDTKVIWVRLEGDTQPICKYVFQKSTKTWKEEGVTVMISGHTDLSPARFEAFYVPALQPFIEAKGALHCRRRGRSRSVGAAVFTKVSRSASHGLQQEGQCQGQGLCGGL